MKNSGLARYLGQHVELTANEREFLASLGTTIRGYRRGAVIRSEHAQNNEILIAQSGWLFCSLVVEDGRRQIIRLHFGGDLLGAEMLAFEEAPVAITALTDAEVCVVDKVRLCSLFVDHPRLGALLFALQQIDRVTLTDRLISIGRSSARGRVAALLLWVRDRLRSEEGYQENSFCLPMTQEEIGDATGLTAVHVNRTIRALTEDGLILRAGANMRILDPQRLARIGHYVERGRQFDTRWLPPAR